jgi:hypothetical protein
MFADVRMLQMYMSVLTNTVFCYFYSYILHTGLLVLGVPLSWRESKKYHAYVKKHGIIQFLNIYSKCKDRRNDVFLWGDEVEGLVVRFTEQGRICRILFF